MSVSRFVSVLLRDAILDSATHSGGLVAVQSDGDVAVVGLEQDSVGLALGSGRTRAGGGGSCRSGAAGLRWRG